MTKNIKIIVGIVILGAVLLVMYYTSMPNVKNGSMMSSKNGKKMAFSQFVKQNNGSYECDVKQYNGEIESEGKVYIGNNTVRADIITKLGDQNVTNVLVVKDGYTYTWTSNPNIPGLKIKNNVNTTAESEQFSSIGDYSCKEWEPSGAMLNIPTSIDFKEVNN